VAETSHIETIANLIELDCAKLTIKSADDILTGLGDGQSFDYVYLCGHADERGFGEEDGSNEITWPSFALALCNANWLNKDGVLFLATCRGGLRQIAENMFNVCGKIDYICGPRWVADKHDLTTAFHVFIYNLEVRGEEPAVAAERAYLASGRHFFCYDRLECCDGNEALSAIRSMIALGLLDPKQVLANLFGNTKSGTIPVDAVSANATESSIVGQM
jgi:hypothetical protein